MNQQSQFTDVPSGKIAAIVTYLEMRSAPQMNDGAPPLPGSLRRIDAPEPDWYLDVYKRIGADLLWFSRLSGSREELMSTFGDPDYAVYALN
ncbi:MAG: GNAT family N-acetyltransferase, partial [Methyloligellaceae bacterium]